MVLKILSQTSLAPSVKICRTDLVNGDAKFVGFVHNRSMNWNVKVSLKFESLVTYHKVKFGTKRLRIPK